MIGANFENSAIPDAVWLTLRARKEWPLPARMVVVYFDGMTGYHVLDTSRRDPGGESPVLLWYPARSRDDGTPQIIAADFGSFFLDAVETDITGPARRRH